MKQERMAMFVMKTETTDAGEFIPCIAVEGKKGYYPTNWHWGKDFKVAESLCEKRNENMGYTKEDVLKIIGSTMF